MGNVKNARRSRLKSHTSSDQLHAHPHPTTISVLRFNSYFPTHDLTASCTSPGRQTFVLIKFARRYLIELHDFRLGLGNAPQILAFERLPGGWYGVAMEWIESGVPITHSTLSAALRKKELQDLVDKFHLAGLVHGDLGDANILCKEESMWLIDFDWGGKDGEVFYPAANLNCWMVGCPDLRITKEDDSQVLKKTLSKL